MESLNIEPILIPEPESSPVTKYKERLLCLVAAGQSKAFLGRNFTIDQIEKLSDKDIEKYYKIYDSTYSSLVSNNIVNGVLSGFSKLVGLIFPVHDADKLSNDLQNNFLVTSQFRNFTGKLAYHYGPLLALTASSIIILNNINFAQHTCPKHDLNDLTHLEQVLEQEHEQEFKKRLDKLK